MPRRPPRHYFCFRSPYSWMAYHYLRRELTDQEWNALEHIPFWEPDSTTLEGLKKAGGRFLYHTMSREKHLYILHDIKRLAASMELSHVWPLDEDPWWEYPNLVYLAVQSEGKGAAFIEAVFRARWQEGRNIHERETLEELVDAVGLDPALVRRAPEDPEIRRRAVEIAQGWERDGLFGVPFFVHRFDKFWGVDRTPAFIASLRGWPMPYFSQILDKRRT